MPPALHHRFGGVALPAAVLERHLGGASVGRQGPVEGGPDPRVHVVADAGPADRLLRDDLVDAEPHGDDRPVLVELQLRLAARLLGDLTVLRPPAAVSRRGGERVEDLLGAATDDDLLFDAAAHDRSSLVSVSMKRAKLSRQPCQPPSCSRRIVASSGSSWEMVSSVLPPRSRRSTVTRLSATPSSRQVQVKTRRVSGAIET